MQARDAFVELLRQHVDLLLVLAGVAEELHLGHHLVGEGARHDEARVPGGAAEIDQPPLGQHDDPLAAGEDHVVDLRLDVFPLVLAQARDVDLGIEVPDIADDGVVLHPLHVVVADDVHVAGRGDEDVGLVGGFLHRHHAITFHRRLQRADRVDLGHPDAGAQTAQRSARSPCRRRRSRRSAPSCPRSSRRSRA